MLTLSYKWTVYMDCSSDWTLTVLMFIKIEHPSNFMDFKAQLREASYS